MKEQNSPITGKPMRLVYEPDTIEYRGEKFDIVYLSYRDDESNEGFTTTESDGVWWNQMTNQYREKHGIPYQDEIIALRERYGVSAAKMSLILGFGANQYRLYEDGEVPSESNGKMIRSAMNPKVFMDLVVSSKNELTDREYEKITKNVQSAIESSREWRAETWNCNMLFRVGRGRSNGYAPVSSNRLKNLMLYVLEQLGDTFQTKMNKVLFYIDFLSYRERGRAISGLSYMAIDFGPVPQRWDRVYSGFEEIVPQSKLVKDQECTILTAISKADMSAFSMQEISLINKVCDKLNKVNAKTISELSHQEPAWQKYHNQPSPIPFEEAFSLRLF